MRGGIEAMSGGIATNACEKSPLGLAKGPPSPERRGGQGVRTALPTRGDDLSCVIATHPRAEDARDGRCPGDRRKSFRGRRPGVTLARNTLPSCRSRGSDGGETGSHDRVAEPGLGHTGSLCRRTDAPPCLTETHACP